MRGYGSRVNFARLGDKVEGLSVMGHGLGGWANEVGGSRGQRLGVGGQWSKGCGLRFWCAGLSDRV